MSTIFTNHDRRVALDTVDEIRVHRRVYPEIQGTSRLLTNPARSMVGQKSFKAVFVAVSPQTNGDIYEDMKRTLKLNSVCTFRPKWLYKLTQPLLKKRKKVLLDLASFGDIQIEQVPTHDGELYCYLAIATPVI